MMSISRIPLKPEPMQDCRRFTAGCPEISVKNRTKEKTERKKQEIGNQMLNKSEQILKDEKTDEVQLTSTDCNEAFCKKCGPERNSCPVQH